MRTVSKSTSKEATPLNDLAKPRIKATMHANDPATRAVLIFKELVCTMVVVGETKVVVESKRADLN